MKASDTPKLDSGWWKKNKAKTLTKTGISEALREYEVAREKQDDAKVLKVLSDLKKAVAGAISKASETLHGDTIAVLKKFPKVIEDEVKATNARIKKADDDAKAPKKGPVTPPKQKIGRDITVWELDVSAAVLKKANPKWLTNFKGFKLALTINGDLVDTLEAEGDYVTPAFMVEDAQDVGKQVVADIASAIDKIDGVVGSKPKDAKKAMEKLEPVVKKIMADAAKELEGIPAKRWKTFVAKNKQYSDYKLKAGANMTLGVLGVAGSVAGVASAVGTAGATLPLAIIGLVRSVASVAKQIVDLSKDADTVGKKLQKDCDTLQDWYKSKGKRIASETGGVLVKGILGVDPGLQPTIGSAENNLELWSNKIAGCTVAGRKASRGIMEAIKKADELEKVVKKAEGKEAQKYMAKLKKAREALDKTLDSITEMMGKVSRFEKNAPALEKVIKALRDDNSKVSNIFEKVFPVTVNLVLAGANFGDGIKTAESAVETASTAIGLFNDLSTEGLGLAGAL